MVFEGPLSATKQRDTWIRLKVGDFAAAVTELRQAQLITGDRDGQCVALKEGIGTDQLVRLLVERGMPVYEIARAEETLESFYLSLMNNQRKLKRLIQLAKLTIIAFQRFNDLPVQRS